MSTWELLQAVEESYKKVMMSAQDNTTTQYNLVRTQNLLELAKNVLKESKNRWVQVLIHPKEAMQ